jgi:hypothetical protein
VTQATCHLAQATCHLAQASCHLAQAFCHLARLLALPLFILLPPDHAYWRQHPSAVRWNLVKQRIWTSRGYASQVRWVTGRRRDPGHMASANCHLACLLVLPVFILLPPDHAYWRQQPSAVRWIWREAESLDKLWVCQPGQVGDWQVT